MLGLPANLRIVFQQQIAKLFRADKPTTSWVLDQRVLAGTPTKRVIVKVLFQQQQAAFFAQGACDWFVGVFDPHALLVRERVGELSVRTDRAHQFGFAAFGESSLLCDQNIMVDFAECGSLVDDAATGIGRHKVCRDDTPVSVLGSAGDQFAHRIFFAAITIKRRFISLTDDRFTFDGFDDREFAFDFFGDLFDERRREH